MNNRKIINRTAAYVKKTLSGESSGHDWWHVYRVWQNAKHISRHEKVDIFTVELAALLHDIADWKLHGTNHRAGPDQARVWLRQQKIDNHVIQQITTIIGDMTYRGPKTKSSKLTTAGQVVQDADRLDALGAVGIARAFAFGSTIGQPIYDPDLKPDLNQSAKQYQKKYRAKYRGQSTTINHFYEKLLLLKNRLNTKTATRIAAARHRYMVEFLKRFYQEWSGKK